MATDALTHDQVQQQLMDIDGLDVGLWDVLLDWLIFIFTWGLLVIVPAILYGLWWWAHRPTKPVREALTELKIKGSAMPAAQWVGAANELLKAECLGLWLREEVAGLEGRQWLHWLRSNVKEVELAPLEALVDHAYSPHMDVLPDAQKQWQALSQLMGELAWRRRLLCVGKLKFLSSD